MSNGYDSLRSVSEFWVQNQNWHNDDQGYQSSPKGVDNQGFGEHFLGVIWVLGSKLKKSIGAVKVGVYQSRHPFGVGNTKKGVQMCIKKQKQETNFVNQCKSKTAQPEGFRK